MILPAKHISTERSMIGIGADILRVLDQPCSVSEAWVRTRERRETGSAPITFDWFLLALCWLYAVRAVDYQDNMLVRRQTE